MRWLALVVLLSPASAQEYRILRDGAYWVRIDSGMLPPPLNGRIRVISPGRINAQGEDRDDIAYVVRRRVQAG
ncbi:MAG TPA: hypothetical protein VM120_02620, partial [Bryobacteraceae bacterium]|nr:hypothetical protein [Bryobacteraceae bacterium]